MFSQKDSYKASWIPFGSADLLRGSRKETSVDSTERVLLTCEPASHASHSASHASHSASHASHSASHASHASQAKN